MGIGLVRVNVEVGRPVARPRAAFVGPPGVQAAVKTAGKVAWATHLGYFQARQIA